MYLRGELEELLAMTDSGVELPMYTRYQHQTLWREAAAEPGAKVCVEKAVDSLTQPIPQVGYTDYKAFAVEGSRKEYQTNAGKKIANLKCLAVAECLERQGRFLDLLHDYIWSLCEETSWVMSAHVGQNQEAVTHIPTKGYDYIDLGTVARGQLLAEILYVLNDQLDHSIRQRIETEVEDRLFTPFLIHSDFWWMKHRNNWNSVCHGGIVNAAILLGLPRQGLALILQKVLQNIRKYMQSFDEDGCTSEGIGYWSYGFGNYAFMADIVFERTAGRLNLFELDPRIKEIVLFPVKSQLSAGTYPNFSDAQPKVSFNPYLIDTLYKHFPYEELYTLPQAEHQEEASYQRLQCVPVPIPARSWPKSVFFAGNAWLVARADEDHDRGLVLAIKGGNNAEDHNHNDCGSFIVHVGGESLVAELGGAPYNKDNFSPRRYTILANRSLGHNVPLVNGCEQRTGKDYEAVVRNRASNDVQDSIELDLTGAYPADANMISLVRTATLHRQGTGIVEVVDQVVFADGQLGSIVSHVYSFHPIRYEGGTLRIEGSTVCLSIEYDGGPKVEVERLENAVGDRSVYRAVFSLEDVERGHLGLKFAPIPHMEG